MLPGEGGCKDRLNLGSRPSSHLWSLPVDELEPLLQDGQRCVRARCSLTEGLSWGPFRGSIQTRASSPGQAELVSSPVSAAWAKAVSSPRHRPFSP